MEEKITSVIDLVATLISQVESGTSHVIIRRRSSAEDKDKPLQKVPQMLYMMIMLLAAMTKQNIRNINMKLGSTRVRIVNASRDDEKAFNKIMSYIEEWSKLQPGTPIIKLTNDFKNAIFDDTVEENIIFSDTFLKK